MIKSRTVVFDPAVDDTDAKRIDKVYAAIVEVAEAVGWEYIGLTTGGNPTFRCNPKDNKYIPFYCTLGQVSTYGICSTTVGLDVDPVTNIIKDEGVIRYYTTLTSRRYVRMSSPDYIVQITATENAVFLHSHLESDSTPTVDYGMWFGLFTDNHYGLPNTKMVGVTPAGYDQVIEVESTAGLTTNTLVYIVNPKGRGRFGIKITEVIDDTHLKVDDTKAEWPDGCWLGGSPCPTGHSEYENCFRMFDETISDTKLRDSSWYRIEPAAMSSNALSMDGSPILVIPGWRVSGQTSYQVGPIVGSDEALVVRNYSATITANKATQPVQLTANLPTGTISSNPNKTTFVVSGATWTPSDFVGKMIAYRQSGFPQWKFRTIVGNTADTITLKDPMVDSDPTMDGGEFVICDTGYVWYYNATSDMHMFRLVPDDSV